MPADVRINQVTTEVTVTDASAMLDPAVLDRIVRAVMARLEAREREQRLEAEERRVGRPHTIDRSD